jgi:uncharacterized protein YprB with RNaseH-like and TPR domain
VKKIIYWDLETSDLNADWGTIYCVGYQIEGEKIKCISITDFPGWEKEPWNDERVIRAFLRVLCREDVGIEVTHYGTNFDIKFLQARMAYHGMGVLPILGHVDTYYAAKTKLAIKSKSLANVADFLKCPFKKTYLDKDHWRRAGRGDRHSLDYIVKHCIADVRVLRWVYLKLAPMLRRHPVLGKYGDCHNCGSGRLQRRGAYIAAKGGPRFRFQCQKCGGWSARIVKEAA